VPFAFSEQALQERQEYPPLLLRLVGGSGDVDLDLAAPFYGPPVFMSEI